MNNIDSLRRVIKRIIESHTDQIHERLEGSGYTLGGEGSEFRAWRGKKTSKSITVEEEAQAIFKAAGTLRVGMSDNEYVTKAQEFLIAEGENLGSTGADGDFRESTRGAVSRFQSRERLLAKQGVEAGVIGLTTWITLIANARERASSSQNKES